MAKLETDRLILRELNNNDVEGMFLLDADKDVHKYLGAKPVKNKTESLAKINFINAQYLSNGIGRWAVINKENSNFMGWAGFKLITEITNSHINYYDLGYRFQKKYWGKGFATEVAIALVNYGFNVLKLKEIFAIADKNNLASIKVLEKAGLKKLELFEYNNTPHYWFKIEENSAHP
jgi:ribosomal-protein-alanine N-acetyltransferase